MADKYHNILERLSNTPAWEPANEAVSDFPLLHVKFRLLTTVMHQGTAGTFHLSHRNVRQGDPEETDRSFQFMALCSQRDCRCDFACCEHASQRKSDVRFTISRTMPILTCFS
jgi:hypothetical protein